MKAVPRPLGQWVLLVLAIAGASIALSLTSVHDASAPLLCSAQGIVNCERVTSSSHQERRSRSRSQEQRGSW